MLDIQGLNVTFLSTGKNAVKGIDLQMKRGERLGLVGESGSGKTVTAMAISGLIERYNVEMEGQILFEGKDIRTCSREEMREIQGQCIGVVFQEPMTSLNPLMKVGYQIEEALRIHTNKSKEELKEIALDTMAKVGLPEPEKTYYKYPHQLSGGQRQRAMIASAMAIHPKLLICDEPTTALDVRVQAQILALLKEVSETYGIAILLISHDLRVVRHLCDSVAVMYGGEIVETGSTEEVFDNPQHEYTKKLIAAIPAREKVQAKREKTLMEKNREEENQG
ncbi:MAG: ABC transporter ATP-binding protein [Firmicutes bacterium]|nr:ABC transporter ATP-binding protein [Bacillota bacterium]